MNLHCDSKVVIYIAYNPIQYDRTNHAEVNRHCIKEKLDSKISFNLRSFVKFEINYQLF